MDAFKLHTQVIDNYRAYLSSVINIADDRIKLKVDKKSYSHKKGL